MDASPEAGCAPCGSRDEREEDECEEDECEESDGGAPARATGPSESMIKITSDARRLSK